MTGDLRLDYPLVVATTNEGKLKELMGILAPYGLDLKCLRDFPPLPVCEEDGLSFEENAVKKSRFYARILGLPTIADDSGLEVYALGNRPGIYSARYASPHASDRENYEKLLKELEGVKQRGARFVCVISVSVPTGQSLVFDGICEGEITEEQMR